MTADPVPLLDAIQWTADGLVPAIVQDDSTGEVLMMAWMDRDALRTTLATGQGHYYSRSRRSSWQKGATSGHVQHVRSVRLDCDGDVLLLRVDQTGGACHAGYRSCFYRRLAPDGRLETDGTLVFDPSTVYGA